MDEKLIPKIDFNEYSKDKYLLDLGNYEIKEENGKIFAVLKKPKYPKTFSACKIQIHECFGIRQIMGYKFDLLERFQKLLLCRDMYWKIAGEEMGLGKPWKPDWTTSGQDRYTIETNYNEVIFSKTQYGYRVILVFPTKEMRDAFYENFKNLIEQCKELL